MPTHRGSDPERPPQAVEVPSVGDVIEVTVTETVDGGLNGAPELAGIEESRDWEAADVVDAMEISAGDLGSAASKTEILERLVAERREVLVERTPEACALGLGALFEAVASATWASPDAPVAADDDVLRERLAQLEKALAQLEGALDAPGERVRPSHGSPAAAQARPSRDERAPARHPGVYDRVARHPAASLLVALAIGGALWSRARARRT